MLFRPLSTGTPWRRSLATGSGVTWRRSLVVAGCLIATTVAAPSAQSDLDDLMRAVLARRDDNWKKLQQYTLTERETLQVTALAVFRLFGFEREYLWLPRAGFFIRSPLKADGVTIGEEKRRQEEERWLRRSQNQEKRAQRRRAEGKADLNGGDDPDVAGDVPCNVEINDNCLVEPLPPPGPGDIALSGSVDDIVSQSFEPEFIQSANFMRFKFDQGQYALVGREKMLNREVLKIEYYPKILFNDAGDDDDNDDNDERRRNSDRRRAQEDDKADQVERESENGMNKTSLVTLWVDPAERQILRYEFRNVDMDFLPARWLVRINSMRATMQMTEPFPNVWLPDAVSMRFRMTLAAGPFEGKYDVRYGNYELAETSGRIVP